jgi:hypothetical protein
MKDYIHGGILQIFASARFESHRRGMLPAEGSQILMNSSRAMESTLDA